MDGAAQSAEAVVVPEPARGASSGGVWLGALGGWRSQVVARGYALSVLLTALHQYFWPVQLERRSIALSWDVLSRHLAARPAEEHWVTVTAAALLLTGPRALTLVPAAVAMTALTRRNMAEPWLFPAVEYVLFAVLPWLGVLTIAGEWGRARWAGERLDLRAAHVDAIHVGCYRLGALTTFAFVTGHKVNVDFLDPALSCENQIAQWLVENWGAIGAVFQRLGSPWLTIVIEGGLPLLLLWWPPLGIAGASAFFVVLGLVGAPSTAGIAMVMTWAFAAAADGAVLRAHGRRIALASALLVAGLVGVLWACFAGTSLSREMIAIVVVMAVIPGVCALAVLAAGRRASDAAVVWPRGGALLRRGVAAVALAVLVVNGLAPYLGLRFNYTFAMWSNLRADQHRWNSLLVPSWVQWWPVSAQLIDVRSVTAVPFVVPIFDTPAVDAATFVSTMRPLLDRAGVRIDADVEWAGTAYEIRGDRVRLAELVASMRSGAGGGPVTIRRATLAIDPPPPPGAADPSPYEARLEPALFSPHGFRRAMQGTARERRNFDVELVYEGRTVRLASTLTSPEAVAFVAGLREDNRYPPKLARTGPQRCFH